jgi:hypothetical protein
VPAVNNHGGFGRWAFVEISDVYDAIGPIRVLALSVPPLGAGRKILHNRRLRERTRLESVD